MRSNFLPIAIRSLTAAVAATVLHLLDLSLLLPVAALVLCALATARSVGWGLRLAVAPMLVLTAVTATAGASQLLGWGLHPLAVYGPIVVVAAAFVRRNAPAGNPPTRRLALEQWVPIACALAAALFIVSPALAPQGPLGRGVAQRLSLSAAAEDGAGHYGLIHAIRVNDGYAYGDGGKRMTMQYSYPQAFHVNVAALDRTLDDTVGAPERVSRLFDVYWLVGIGVFSLLVLAASSLPPVLRASGAKLSPMASAAGSLIAGCAVLFWYPFGIFSHNFFPQVTTLWLLLTLALTAIALGGRSTMPFAGRILLLGVPVVAIGGAWPFLLPIAAGIVAVWLIINREAVLQHRAVTVVGALVTTIAGSAPGFIFAKRQVDVSVINAAGGIEKMPVGAIAGVALLALAALLVFRERLTRASFTVSLTSVLLTGAFTASFAIYQLATAGELNYFYFKSAHTVVVLGIAVAATGGAFALGMLATRGRGHVVAAGLLVAATLLLTGIADRDTGRAWSYREERSLWPDAAAFSSFVDQWERREGDIFVVWTGNPPIDYIDSRWSSVLSGHDDEQLISFLQGVVLQTQDINELQKFADRRDERIVALSRDPATLQQQLRRARTANSKRIDVLPTS